MRGGAGSTESSYINTCFAWAPLITRAMDIYTGLSYCRNVDPDAAVDSSLEPDVTMVPGSSSGLSVPDGPSSSLFPGSDPRQLLGSWW